MFSPFILTPPAFLPHSPLRLSTSTATLYRCCNPNLSLLLLSPHPHKSLGARLLSFWSAYSGRAGFAPSFCTDCPAQECNAATWRADSSSRSWALHQALPYDHEFVHAILAAQSLGNTKPVGCFSKLGLTIDASVLISNSSVFRL